MKRWLLIAILLLISLGGLTAWLLRPAAQLAGPMTRPVSQPVESPASQPSPQPKIVRTYVDAIVAANPAFPATQPLSLPLDASEAAHVQMPGPLRLCDRRDMWITSADAPPVENVLAGAYDDESHVTRDVVAFVSWTRTDKGRWEPLVVVSRDEKSSAYDVVSRANGRRPLPTSRPFDWQRAANINETVAAPTDTGVSVFDFGDKITEHFHEIPAKRNGRETHPQIVAAGRGIVAWRPGGSAARFVDGKWSDLAGDNDGWSNDILHLIPLLDGSVLQMSNSADGTTQLSLCVLEAEPIDQARITQLVDQLFDPEPANRDAAYDELTRYGPGLWPILEKLLPDQPPESQVRIQQLLHNRITPAIGGMTLVDGKLQLQTRFDNGGALFYARAGVNVPRPNAVDESDTLIVAPVWFVIRPGRAVQRLPDTFARELAPGKFDIAGFGDEWIVFDLTQGPRRFMGNHFRNLLKPEEKVTSLVGVDRRGRWIFRTGERPGDGVLIVDHTLPDPSPRLPVWTMRVGGGRVGWNAKDWPVIDRGGAWVLEEKSWRPLGPKETFFIDRPAAQQPATRPADQLVLTDPAGTRYFDGQTTLTTIDKSGKKIIWRLPPVASGRGEVSLIRANDGRLFLFNEPGRVLRIKPTPDEKEPFAIEATFTRGIPNTPSPTRIWLDPAGRINIVSKDDQTLSVLFPAGQVPPAIAEMMPAER